MADSFAGAFGAVFGSFVIFDFSGKRQSLSDRSQVVLDACSYNGVRWISASRPRNVAAARDHHHRQPILIEARDERGREAFRLQCVGDFIPTLEASGVGKIVRASA